MIIMMLEQEHLMLLVLQGRLHQQPDNNYQLFSTPPDDVQNFTGNVTGNALNLSWTPVSNADLSHYKIRYSSLTSGASYQNAVDIVDKISRPGNTAVVPAKDRELIL